jgi:hypothetical protein
MSRQYDFTLPATVGASVLVSAVGSVCRMVSTPGGAVRVRTSQGATYDIEAGQGFQLKEGETFQEIYISNITGVAQTGTVFVGSSSFIDTRIPGQVSVIDGAVASVAANLEYLTTATCGATPAAGAYGNIQIWNGSTTKGVAIRQITFQSSTLAQQLRLRMTNAAISGSFAQIGSKRSAAISSGGSIGINYNANGTTATGNDQNGLIAGMNFGFNVPAGVVQLDVPGLQWSPILLPPGHGLLCAAGSAASDFQALFGVQIIPWIYG